MGGEKIYTLDSEHAVMHRMSHHARSTFASELRYASIALNETKSDGWSFHGMLRDETCRVRLIAPNLDGVKIKEEARGDITQLTITDRGFYTNDAPLRIQAKEGVGVISLVHGNKQIDPIRLVTDAAKQLSVIEYGLRPKSGEKLMVLLNGVKARQYRHDHGSFETKALLFHRSMYEVFENQAVKDAVRSLLRAHDGDEIGHEIRSGSHIPFHAYAIRKQGVPSFVWVVPSIYANRHELIHEESSGKRLPLAYSDMRKVRSVITDGAGYHGVADGELVNNWIIKKEQFVYEPGFMPQLAESKSGLYQLEDSSRSGIPVIFQGCVLRVKGKAYHAAEIRSDSLRSSLS